MGEPIPVQVGFKFASLDPCLPDASSGLSMSGANLHQKLKFPPYLV